MAKMVTDTLSRAVAERAVPLVGATSDFKPLLDAVGDARIVLIGEATHGTHEFYRLRAQLTKQLIQEKGFCAVAAEADWPDAYRVNRYVRALGADGDAAEALRGFRRFPAWMWRNADVLDFVGWLRTYNDQVRGHGTEVGFYGLDLYSLNSSVEAVLDYLDKADPEAAARARYRYACFDHLAEDPQSYGYAASFGLRADCERQVIAQLVDLQRRRQALLGKDGQIAEDDQFEAEQNALVVANAEEYYRSMFSGRVFSWNVRDTHMADTLDALRAHLEKRVGDAKVAVWAHNSHVGDARATEMGAGGELSIGQLARQRYPEGDVRLFGFSTFGGTVTAASKWDGPAERKTVRPALADSYEAAFHATDLRGFVLRLRGLPDEAAVFREARLQRAIGVLYLPETERVSHYFAAHLPRQLDAIIHVDETRAVEPLERTSTWHRGEIPETYPTGI